MKPATAEKQDEKDQERKSEEQQRKKILRFKSDSGVNAGPQFLAVYISIYATVPFYLVCATRQASFLFLCHIETMNLQNM